MDQIINHAVLSLDFWQDTVTYEGPRAGGYAL